MEVVEHFAQEFGRMITVLVIWHFRNSIWTIFACGFHSFYLQTPRGVMFRRMGVEKKRLPLQGLEPVVRDGQEGCGVRPAVSFVFLI